MLTKQQKFLLAQLVRENKDVLLRKFGSPGKKNLNMILKSISLMKNILHVSASKTGLTQM
jgi:hypothetical protein